MSDKQTTAIVLLGLLALIFWLYNSKAGSTNKLQLVVDNITGKTVTTTQGQTNSVTTIPYDYSQNNDTGILPQSSTDNGGKPLWQNPFGLFTNPGDTWLGRNTALQDNGLGNVVPFV